MGCVYLLTIYRTNQNPKKYVGQTKRSMEERFKEHLSSWSDKKEKNSNLSNDIKLYGVENVECESLFESDNIEDLNEIEKFYILEFRTQDDNFGYNVTRGKSRKVNK